MSHNIKSVNFSEKLSALLIHFLGILSCVDKLDVLDDDDEFVSVRSFYTDLAAIRATNCLYRKNCADRMFLDSDRLYRSSLRAYPSSGWYA